ncbi:MAG: diacylglycerol kinase family protein [Candidatus Levybacteria bacterium]|nr:diacylglycerol kinase family protein [Candidatus Levybacteria bacterium]
MVDLKQLVRSFSYAFEGVIHALKSDQNLRIHFVIAAIVIAVSIYFQVTPYEMGILGVMILLVIITEMINTAIEKMVDLITKEQRAEAKVAKDVSSGMVFVAAFGSVIIGLLIFLPYVLRMFR